MIDLIDNGSKIQILNQEVQIKYKIHPSQFDNSTLKKIHGWVLIDLSNAMYNWFKVHIFWEGHKSLRNLPLTFDYSTYSQRGRFRKILWPSQYIWTLTQNWAYVGQPDSHINTICINLSYLPKDQSLLFWRKNIENWWSFADMSQQGLHFSKQISKRKKKNY